MSKQYQPAGFEADDYDDEEEFMFDDDYDVDDLDLPSEPTGVPVNAETQPRQSTFGKRQFNIPPITNGFSPRLQPGNHGNPHRDKAERRFGGRKQTIHSSPVQNCLPQEGGNREMILDDFRRLVMNNDVTRVQKCLDDGVSANTVFNTGWSALMYAAQGACSQTAKLLLDNGADANFQKDLFSVLMAACSAKSSRSSVDDILNCVKLLTEHKAEINSYDRQHMSPLMYAARLGYWEVIEHLCSLNVTVDKQDNKGWTALMWATWGNHRRVAEVLITAGASLDKTSSDGRNVLEIAMDYNRTEIESLLKKNGASIKDSLLLTEPITSSKDNEVVTASSKPSFNSAPPMEGPPARDSSQAINDSTDSIAKYGELEMFLSGISLGNLIPVFHSHQLQFTDLLRLQDKDLLELGITQLGLRKRILDAIQATHKTPWETSSLNNIQYNKQLKCAEVIAILANINKHAKYIGSTVGFVSDQVQDDITILQKAQEGASVEDIVRNAEESIVNVTNLYEELVMLRRHLNKVCKKNDFSPPDLISPTPRRKSSTGRRICILLALGGIGLVVWKADSIADKCSSIYNRLTP